ncbi:DUF317 domain-containing protein [Kitasatospora sp. NPDC059463]|uniref:DUF317 domain-containing protein n=1 Tax=unclassified Kitasatospora TaxID=2633591 RepID=UPI0036BB17F6
MAGPGDAEGALADFLDESPAWGRHSPGQDTTVALHEQLTAVIELNHEARNGPRWTIAGYRSPVSERTWSATFCPKTPVEVVMAVANQLSYALSATSEQVRDDLLWGRRSLDNTIAADLEATGEPWPVAGPALGHYSRTRPDGTAGIEVDHHVGDLRGIGPTITVWAGPRGYDSERWKVTFTGHTPTALISAAFDEVVRPLPAIRLRSQIPAAQRTQVHLEPRRRRNSPSTSGQPRSSQSDTAVERHQLDDDRWPSTTARELADRIDDVTTRLVRTTDPAEARRLISAITGEGGVMERSARTLRAAGGWAAQHRIGGDAGESLQLTAAILDAGREAGHHAATRLGAGATPRAVAALTRVGDANERTVPEHPAATAPPEPRRDTTRRR